jgi:pSer/pThr/pTyr-binding forkhead associated (FHA) protein
VYEFFIQISKYVFIGLIYYFLYNFLKVMFVDLIMEKEKDIKEDIGFILLDERGNAFTLYDINTIGRAPDADIVIEDPFLSSKHALIAKKGRKVIIQDLHSTNGVFVNGKRIKKPVALKENDEITMGQYKYSFLRRKSFGVEDGVNL